MIRKYTSMTRLHINRTTIFSFINQRWCTLPDNSNIRENSIMTKCTIPYKGKLNILWTPLSASPHQTLRKVCKILRCLQKRVRRFHYNFHKVPTTKKDNKHLNFHSDSRAAGSLRLRKFFSQHYKMKIQPTTHCNCNVCSCTKA